jgi:hypothetical protein
MDTETLIQKQRRFAGYVARLIQWVNNGPNLSCRFGEAWRTPEQAQWNAAHGLGITHSVHVDRLAVDLLIDKDGIYQALPDSYSGAGAFWKSLAPDCCWGGDFTSRDANHFSIENGGYK